MDASNTDLKSYPQITLFLDLICKGAIPITSLLSYTQMQQLYDLLWVEIYEAQQKKEEGNERVLGTEATGQRES